MTFEPNPHVKNVLDIINALVDQAKKPSRPAKYLDSEHILNSQSYIHHKFKDIIDIPSFRYVSKVPLGWLIVGDNREEISAKISLVIERYGLGVGMMVLHGQQMSTKHILTEVEENGVLKTLVERTKMCWGTHKERVLYVPIRKYRADFDKLSELNIAKPKKLWDSSLLVRHNGDTASHCFYCSASEINPAEVVVTITGKRLGLSRNYSLGFTYAPFGNPLTVMHFLAWDHASNPLDMSRTPMTVSDLVEMTRLVNISIRNFFGGTGITDYPVIDGVSNGWAGNSIYHQHFQFFQPEYSSPITEEYLVNRNALVQRDDISINKLSWPTPIYRIAADDAINVGLVGNDMAGIWRLQGVKKNNENSFTQNIYVTGQNLGKKAYVLLRDRNKVNFIPSEFEFVDTKKTKRAQTKRNIGILEASGTLIVDDLDSFEEMAKWEPADISEQLRMVANAVAPQDDDIEEFENSIRTLFP